ncbi:MAG: glycerophosphodiester phosphodiesterase family protein [Flavobacteriaceae bacterium]|nr:glycerophosphodiester phosphodiesterase family protein [Flavobacteriaceae bacterium]MDC1459348.1 glycerophosphodiester phosphodiesterase family protein [Flavobacteriaceae bacterium]MDG1032525.1 glycerophosphodiester phosphodiesterase family protein [Flavobacteriaceae bacterium]MDG1344209.1 glycerophosphodiester phosphodiesterase family protein [Flavobacteriaceae bacterium]MDG1792096.1 glycerophosphodiester phosphodiesterase family protein [Flavobacteriaceae bacterium]
MKKVIFLLLFFVNLNAQNSILNIGHRGAKGHVAENTIASIKKAIELGADGIEIDVFRCLTGEIVLFHDKTLDNLSNGTGYIEEKSLSELKELNILGSKHSIPTLEEVIKSIGKEVFLNIELKGPDTSKGSLEMVNKYVKSGKIKLSNILFSSFNWNELVKLRNLDSDVKIALITGEDPLEAISPALSLNAIAINPNYKKLNKDNVQKIFSSGLKIYTWTVNNKLDIIKVKSLKVNGIITDFPERI